ncbi:uncharacterized protein LOC128220159 [Mya arenaria]|uniref:uncharacterized protein LOC128220159 n=1 Tax=Mya arenaria TaxID=6604 RepID=UPI0022E16281|nr:uncharacterized protein LOC128220159 [Mya arenaria]
MDHHHRSLCPKKFGGKTTNVHLSEEIREDPSHNSATKGHVLISSDEMVLMQTAKASVGNRDTSVHETTRLLFDSGSQRTYITERLANKLGLKPTAEQELKLVTFGSEHTKVIKTKTVNIDITLKDGSCMKLTANVVPTISGTIQRNPLTKVLSKQMEHLINSVDLSDTIPRAQETTTIDVLIGNDYYLDIVLPQRIEIEPGLYLLSSKLGWILTGRLSEVESGTDTLSMFVLTHGTDITKQSTFSSLDASIPTKPDLEDFWNIESIGIIDNVDKSDDDIVMRKFQDTVRFDDGRYQVTWPWREEDFELPSNRQLALGRLRSTVARMCKIPELFKKYNTVIEDQLEKGVIEKVNFGDQDGVVHYIPHHAVITPQKTTTKLRVVYDASAKTRNENHSLNECLYRGPVILQQLCGMLIRFRMHRIAITADIEKAFLQIGLQLDQRDVTRFLWLKNCETPTVDKDNIQEFRFRRVPFGVISSPFLLGATVQTHMDKYSTSFAQQVKDNIYVDNLITGTNTDGEAICCYKEVKSIFKEASMNIREWMTNSEIVNQYIPSNNRADGKPMTVLGLYWNPKEDTIALKPTEAYEVETITKRVILKVVASTFDPLGLFSPVTLNGKLLMQQLWKEKLDWDDIVSDHVQEWKTIKLDLERIPTFKLKRCVTNEADDSVTYSLVCFCDASERAYSSAIYLRQITDRAIKVELIFSKARLAPVKGMTIPKLEIMAVVIGVRCLEYVQSQVGVPIEQSVLYTDSQCVLKWISSEKKLPVFVQNKVNEIKKHTGIRFAYVKTTENPADIATRGYTVEKLTKSELWWNGPSWLMDRCYSVHCDSESTMCVSDTCVCVELGNEPSGENENQKHELKTSDECNAPFDIRYDTFSSVTRLIRVTAYVKRYLDNLRSPENKKRGALSTSEICEAEWIWLKYIQKKH